MGLLRMVWVRPGVGIQFVTCGCQTVVAHCALYPQTGNTGINIRLLEQPWATLSNDGKGTQGRL